MVGYCVELNGEGARIEIAVIRDERDVAYTESDAQGAVLPGDLLYAQLHRTVDNCLEQFRRVTTRYEKCTENYEARLTIAAILL
jgi:hypothetical protein